MASLSYVPSRACWRVRWRATHHSTGAVFAGSRCLDGKPEAARLWADMEAAEKLFRTGASNPADDLVGAAAEFGRYCLRHTRRTQDLYRRAIRRFLTALPHEVRRAGELKTRHIEDYLCSLAESGLKNRTLNVQLTPIKAFCRWLARRGNLPNPAAAVAMLREDPPASRFLTPEEYERLLAVADPVNRDRLIFLAHTGLRASEFSELIRSGRLAATATCATVTGKGRRRTVPLNAACRAAATRPGLYHPCGRTGLLQAFHKLARKAKIPPFGPHALRHYFATQMLLRGVPIAIVARLLGHSVRVCETTYAHILPQDIADATAVLETAHPL